MSEPSSTVRADLQDSAETTNSLFVEATVGIARINFAGRIIEANPHFCNLVDRSVSELSERTLKDITYSDDRARLETLVERVLGNRQPITVTLRYQKIDGAVVWVDNVLSALQNAEGSLSGLMIVTTPVVENKYSARMQAIYEGALRHTPDFIYVIGLDGRFIYANKALLDMWGKTPETAIGRSLLELGYEPWHAEMHLNEIREVRKTGKPIQGEVPFTGTAGRHIYEYIFAPLFDEEGNITAIAGTTRDVTDRRAAEAAVMTSKERETTALQASEFIGIWTLDLENDLVVADERFARLYSVDPEWAARGAPIAEFLRTIHPDDLSRVVPVIKKVIAEGEVFAEEYRLVKNDGQIRWVVARGRVHRDASGKGVRFTGAVVDITEQKNAEQKLRESEQQFRQLTDALPQQVWTARPDGAWDYVNAQTQHYMSDMPTLQGALLWPEVVHPDDLGRSMTAWLRCVETGEPFEIEQRFLHKESNHFRWHLTRAIPVRNADGQIIKWFGTNTDIEEQKRAAEAVNEAREHLSLMVESAVDYAILSTNAKGHINSWNNGAERVFGYTANEAFNQHISLIFTPEDRKTGMPEREIRTATEKGRAKDERWHIRKNGERFFASGIMASMIDSEGKPKGFIKIARDSTKEKQAQEAIIAARNAAETANIAKSEFLANMSHEIRTPMNAVIGLSNILGMTQPLTTKQKEFIATLQASADSLLTLINDLLDIAKIEARTVELERVPFSVMRLVQEVISMMAVRAQEKGLNFELHDKAKCEENKIFIGDPTRLRQILVNLCSNAIKFTEKGSVHIDLKCESTLDPMVDNLIFVVRDTGIGIPDDKIDTVFQKFVQADSSINRKYGGTGLGLAITKTLTEIMGGCIRVESREGYGSTFTVALMLTVADQAQQEAVLAAAPGVPESVVEATRRLRILLAEDYAPNVMVATAFLEEFGYEFDVASNGVQALEMARKGSYAAVLMDVQMHGMNGLEATSMIREYERQMKKPRLPIIGMTAHAMAGDRERCLAADMDDYISKPFKPTELKAMLKRAIQKK